MDFDITNIEGTELFGFLDLITAFYIEWKARAHYRLYIDPTVIMCQPSFPHGFVYSEAIYHHHHRISFVFPPPHFYCFYSSSTSFFTFRPPLPPPQQFLFFSSTTTTIVMIIILFT